MGRAARAQASSRVRLALPRQPPIPFTHAPHSPTHPHTLAPRRTRLLPVTRAVVVLRLLRVVDVVSMLLEELRARSQRDARRYEKKSSAYESLRAQNIDLREALEREQKAREALEGHYKGRVEELNMALQVAVEEFAKEGLDYSPSGELVRVGKGSGGWEGGSGSAAAAAPPWHAAGSSREGAAAAGAAASAAAAAAAAVAAASTLEARSTRSGGSKSSSAARHHQHRVSTLPPAAGGAGGGGAAAALAALASSSSGSSSSSSASNPALRKRAGGASGGSGGSSGSGSGSGGGRAGGVGEGESYHSAEEE
jgi:hypothetical protein